MTDSKEDDNTPLRSKIKVEDLDIEFSNISYTIRDGDKSLQLLQSLSGYFQSGKLSAILGPSGAGKTTLLNILADCNINCDEGGNVLINGKPREMFDYRSICSYIMQDVLLQPHLTVMEAVTIVSRLKIDGLTEEMRRKKVEDVLKTFGISECANTRSEVLSGGEKKRLCIALEIINNPSILFFDEPTTGLDNHAAKLVMQSLKKLAIQGHTIICSVHQPPPLEFQAYDHSYFIAKGTCVFSGPPSRLVPFLEEVNMPCPVTYSPADYIMELVSMNPQSINHLAAAVAENQNLTKTATTEIQEENMSVNKAVVRKTRLTTPPVSRKILVLLHRMFLQHWRNRQRSLYFLLIHITCGIMIGTTYFGIANNARQFINNAKLAMILTVFCIFPNTFIHVMHLPLQIKIIRQEYSNGWYDELSYYIAATVSTIPFMLGNIISVTVPAYLISQQPLEFHRIAYFLTLMCLTGICSEGLGTLIGTLVNIKNGCILGLKVLAALFALSCHGLGSGKALELFWIVIMQLSFMRHALVGCWVAFFGLNRQPLECNDVYCYWSDPKTVLNYLGAMYTSPWVIFGSLLVNTALFRVLAFYGTRYRLRGKVPRMSDLLQKCKCKN